MTMLRNAPRVVLLTLSFFGGCSSSPSAVVGDGGVVVGDAGVVGDGGVSAVHDWVLFAERRDSDHPGIYVADGFDPAAGAILIREQSSTTIRPRGVSFDRTWGAIQSDRFLAVVDLRGDRPALLEPLFDLDTTDILWHPTERLFVVGNYETGGGFDPENPAGHHLYLVDLTGSAPAVQETGASLTNPYFPGRWSDDGTLVSAWLKPQYGPSILQAARLADGSLTDPAGAGGTYYFDFSPAGDALVMSVAGGDLKLKEVSATGEVGEGTVVADILTPQELDWAPDGTVLAATDSLGRLYAIDMTGTFPAEMGPSIATDAQDPRWSPDSRWLVAESDEYLSHRSWLIPRVEGTTFGEPLEIEGRWFGGVTLRFVLGGAGLLREGGGTVELFDLSGSEVGSPTSLATTNGADGVLSPDGTKLFVATAAEEPAIVDLATGDLQVAGPAASSTLSPLLWTAKGTLAYVVRDFETDARPLFLLPADGSQEPLQVSSNADEVF